MMFFPFLLASIIVSLGRGERIAGISDDGLDGLLSSMIQLTYYLPPLRTIIYEAYRHGLDNDIVRGLACAFVDLQASSEPVVCLEDRLKTEVKRALDHFQIQGPEALLRWLIEAVNIEKVHKMFGASQPPMSEHNALDNPKHLYTLHLGADLRPLVDGTRGEGMQYQLKRFVPFYVKDPSETSSISDQLTLIDQTYILVGFISYDSKSKQYISVLRTNMEDRDHSWHQFGGPHVIVLSSSELLTHKEDIKLLLYVVLSEANGWKLASYHPSLPPRLLDRHLSKRFGTDYILAWILIIAGVSVVLLTIAIFIFIS